MQNEEFPFTGVEENLLTQNYNRIWSIVIIDQLVKSGVKNFYLSPGMRNAPLIHAITLAKNIDVIDIIDERAAAYRALGRAKATKSPSVLICTSGTALSNYLPAILEAKSSNVPLIIISADRPVSLVTHGANQSIKQTDFYGDSVTANLNLPVPSKGESLFWLASCISHITSEHINSPIHINAPFMEPLDKSEEIIDETTLLDFNSIIAKEAYYKNDTNTALGQFLDKHNNLLISIGNSSLGYLNKHTLQYLKESNIPLYIDVTSSNKYSFNLSTSAIPSFDHPEVYKIWNEKKPTGIIHIGGRMTSKHYYRFLSENPEVEILQINKNKQLINPSNSKIIKIDDHFNNIASKLKQKESFSNFDYSFIQKKQELIDKSEISFPSLSKDIIENITDKESLYLANSTLIRSFDLYSSYKINKNIDIYSHRGVSGIEGFIASAIGAADKINNPITLVIGDVSLLYDLSSLSMLNNTKSKVTIILANNYGGGIFSLLPIAKEKEVLKHMQTSHEHNFKKACEQFHIDYCSVNNKDEFLRVFKETTSNCRFIEVTIEHDKNCALYDELKTVKYD